MAEDTPETSHFGLTRVGRGEAITKNGNAFLDLDRVKVDDLLYAALTHTHDGAPALGDPTDPPTLSASPSGGNLPAATTFYYRVSFVDQYGLETSASTEASVTTPNPVAPPTAAATAVETTSGTVSPGIYSYLITYTDSYGGETTPSPLASAQVISGTTNRIRLDLPDMPTGIVGFSIYRTRPGQSAFYFLGSSTTTTFYDAGAAEDQSVTAPTANSTNASNSITITIPLGFIPEGSYSWKIYRATASGDYDGNSLVHQVVEGLTDTSTTPRTDWTDLGDELQQGFPQNISSSVPSGSLLTLNQLTGQIPLSATPRGAQSLTAFAPGVITNSQVVSITESPGDVLPVRLTAFFKTAPTAGGTTVRFRVIDAASNYVEIACSPTTHISGDPTGFFHVEYPLLLSANFEAETGTRSNTTDVVIDNDLAASSGQAVTLDAEDEWVQVDLGSLDPGLYHPFATVRVLAFDTVHTGADLTISAIRTDTDAVLATTSFTLAPTDPAHPDATPADFIYQELTGPDFTAPGGVDVVLRVAKDGVTDSVQSYNVDKMRYQADVPTLAAGRITVQAFVDSGPTTSADVNLVLWF